MSTPPDVPRSSIPASIAVLASGGGSNLQVLLDHFRGPAAAHGRIVLVGSDKATAGALTRAHDAGVPTIVIEDPRDGDALVTTLRAAGVDLLVLAGYLKLVPEAVVNAYHGRTLNVHPALLPAFGGAGMYGQRIHTAVLDHGATVTGVTVHFVDAQYDRGPIIAQWPVPVLPGDTPASLGARVLRAEHRLFPLCVEAVACGAVALDADGKVHGRALTSGAVAETELRFGIVPDTGEGLAAFASEWAALLSQ